jgi:fatty acid desaturase
VVKICARCHEVSPGGFRCDFCGGALLHTDDARAKDLPETVWKQQRVDYGARRGMIVRFLAIFAGFFVAVYGFRASVTFASPFSYAVAAASLAAGILVWWTIYVAAGRAVRVWVLRRGQVHKRKLARALLAQAVRSKSA